MLLSPISALARVLTRRLQVSAKAPLLALTDRANTHSLSERFIKAEGSLMKKLTLSIVSLCAAALGPAVSASSPEAWQQLDRRVNRACLSASGLAQAKVVTDKASFSDRVPVELRIVEGYNTQSVIDVKLCAFDRRTGRATTTDWVGRLGVNRN